MQMNFEKPKVSSNQEALSQIMGIYNQIMQSGSVDSEKSDFNLIVDKLKKGEISASKALDLAIGIERSRQDYH